MELPEAGPGLVGEGFLKTGTYMSYLLSVEIWSSELNQAFPGDITIYNQHEESIFEAHPICTSDPKQSNRIK